MDNLNYNDLITLTEDYHEETCDSYECITYAEDVSEKSYKIELVSGVNYHGPEEYTPMTGVIAHIWRPLIDIKLFVKTGFLYSVKWNSDKNDGPGILNKYNYSIKVPVSLYYVYGKGDFRPTLSIGYNTGNYFMMSVEGGFLYSINENYELNFNASAQGLLATLMFNRDTLNHTFNVGLVYELNW